MPHRGRKRAREAKYTIGFDHADGVDTTVIGPWVMAFNHADQTSPSPVVVVIDGEFEVVETDPTRLLDAGGSEP